jgi:hypothetical protein
MFVLPDREDAEATKRFAAQKDESEKFIKDNEDQQDDLERQLQKLGTERLRRSSAASRRTTARRSGRSSTSGFWTLAPSTRSCWSWPFHNCDLAIRAIRIIKELVAEECSAIKARYDKTNKELADFCLLVHQEYFGVFRRLHKTLGQLLNKKEKKFEEVDRMSTGILPWDVRPPGEEALWLHEGSLQPSCQR